MRNFSFSLSVFLASLLGVRTAAARTKTEVLELVKREGATPPAWFASTALRHPPTLDLTWAEHKGPWDPNKNLGQFIWSVVNENETRWREGIRLLHHVLVLNKDHPAALNRTMGALGTMYHDLHADFFFSSRRRHTRCLSDWSSDVCSSD